MTDYLDREANSIIGTYRRLPIEFVRGEGSWLVDSGGAEYLDCLSGISVTSIGHAHPRVAAAVSLQASELVHVSNLFYTRPQIELAERLCGLSGLDRVFFANDGATANEAAIKLARRWATTHKTAESVEIVSLSGSFHGRTLATLAATGQPEKQQVFRPLPPGFRQVPAGDISSLEEVVGDRTAAVMIETIQGEGGVIPLETDYLLAVRALCDQRQTLLVVDDVQAGVGRTGSWFSWQQLGFEPDIATSAKALASGLPIGACLASAPVSAAFRPGDHATTFGGGPVVCAAALATLDVIEQEGLLENARAREAQFREMLAGIAGVAGVRGRGLLLAAVLDKPVAVDVVLAATHLGLIVNNVRPDAIRLAPPLNISTDEVALAVERLGQALQTTL